MLLVSFNPFLFNSSKSDNPWPFSDLTFLSSVFHSATTPTPDSSNSNSPGQSDSVFTRESQTKEQKGIGISSLRAEKDSPHSRLSQSLLPIIRHDNSGPKFGIRTIHSNYVLAQTDGVAAGMAEKFHSPTPWHSCILRLSEDGKHFFLSAKASEVRKYGAEKGKEAKFFPSNCGEGRGGFFYFGELESPAS